MNKIINGDSLNVLKKLEDDSVDMICTDPPYGYSFMGKDWDKAVPSVKLWKECVRVLKPGGFCFVMSAPRADVQGEMIKRLDKSGFRTDFTPIYWTYASGFPKAANIGKMVDKKLGKKREVTGKGKAGAAFHYGEGVKSGGFGQTFDGTGTPTSDWDEKNKPASDEANQLDGSFGGYQPKPAVEVILVCMKPITEKTYVGQALNNGKGVTWLNDVRIPTDESLDGGAYAKNPTPREGKDMWTSDRKEDTKCFERGGAGDYEQPQGRFPSNLIVQDDMLNDGLTRPKGKHTDSGSASGGIWSESTGKPAGRTYGDEGSYSRFFDLDRWWESRVTELPESVQATFPFMIVPKASKSEKNEGCDNIEPRVQKTTGRGLDNCMVRCPEHDKPIPSGKSKYACGCDFQFNKTDYERPKQNFHPTVKPIELMSYLVTLGSRKDDLVVDPFVGSGTTCIAAKLLGRNYMGVEKDEDYAMIATERVKSHQPKENQKASEFFTL